ncbi:MAG: glycosyltransferase family 4 protein [Gammaproteobacteria bacterium]|nr:glycosyltransferase family 4 protein [Gammaproteobacteria bacterium]
MHVWIVNHFALTPDQPGGTRHIELSKELQKHDIEVTIVGAGKHHISDRNHVPKGKPWFREKVQGVRFHWIKTPSSSPNYLRRVWNNIFFAVSVISRRGLKDLPRPEVIVGTSPDLISALSAYLASRFFKVPFVLEIRDIWPLSIVQIGLFSQKHPFIVVLRLIERFLYSHADWIVTLLPDADQHIVPSGGAHERITWVPNGVTIGDQAPANHYVPAASGDFTLMYAGSHGDANNLGCLLDAAALLKKRGQHHSLKIRMIGGGPNREALISDAKRRSLNFVSFEQAVPKSQIGKILCEADAFCLVFYARPIYGYGMSANKLFDYMAVGRPVVMAFDAGYNPVTAAKAGICIPSENAEALADAIFEMMQKTASERLQMGLNAQAYAKENHSMKLLGGRLAEVLLNIVRKGQRNGKE